MSSEPPVAAPTFRVSYETTLAYNRDLAGEGTVAVHPDGFVFTGRERRLIGKGAEVVLRFGPADVLNVTQAGTTVEFSTRLGRSGAKNTPFVFFCRTDGDAAAIASLLPATKDEAYTATQAFQRQLAQISTAPRGLNSVTNWLIGANVAAFVVMGFLGAGWLETASMRPYYLWVGNNAAATTDGEWWRLVTSMFVHYGVLHLLLNMWALFQVGHLVEKLLGRPLFTVMYLGSGVIGGLSTLLWHGDKVWSAGASGAVFGVFGALLGYLWREKHGIPKPVLQPLLKSTLSFAAYNLIFGAIHPHIDNVAHVGGLLAGIVLGWISALPLDADVRRRRVPGRLALALAVIAIALGLGIARAPRYAYTVRDEFAWAGVMKPRIDKEKAVLAAGSQVFSHAPASARDDALLPWVRDEALPFHESWRRDLARLTLTPGRATAKKRDALVRILDLKIAAFQELRDGLQRHDPSARQTYAERQTVISSEIRRQK